MSGCGCGETHHEGANYYVSVVRDTAKGPHSDYRLLAGPFPTHEEALAWVDRARELALEPLGLPGEEMAAVRHATEEEWAWT